MNSSSPGPDGLRIRSDGLRRPVGGERLVGHQAAFTTLFDLMQRVQTRMRLVAPSTMPGRSGGWVEAAQRDRCGRD